MAELRYNISQLFNAAFGIAGKALIRYKDVSLEPEQEPQLDYTGIRVEEIDEANITSKLGLPVLFPITFIGGEYKIIKEGKVENSTFGELALPYTAVADFKRGKKIKKTEINGGSGTVKEIYGFDDWSVRIRGIIIDDNPFKFPEQQFTQLLQMENIADSIGVRGKLFELLSIYKLTIEDMAIMRLEGKPNVVPFQMNCVSDQPYELIIE